MDEFVGVIYRIIGSCVNVYIGSSQNYTSRKKQHLREVGENSNSKLLKKPLRFEIIRHDIYKLEKTMQLVEQYYLDNEVNINTNRAYNNDKTRKLTIKKNYNNRKEIVKSRYIQNKESILKKQKDNYRNNKDNILKKNNIKYHENKQKTLCECGANVFDLVQHYSSKKHKEWDVLKCNC